MGFSLGGQRNGLQLNPFGGGARTYAEKVLALLGASSFVGYWPMWEPSGSVATDISIQGNNGAYTGVTLAQPGIGDGRTSASFDGSTSFNNVYSAGLNTDFNNAELSVLIWAKMANAGVWTDATVRNLAQFRADASNLIRIIRTTTDNQLSLTYTAGGTSKIVSTTALAGSTNWFHLALAVSKAGDAVKAYINGVQSGATLNGLGVWAGALATTVCNIGANATTPTNVNNGFLAHAILLNRAATDAEVLAAATVP